MFRSLRSRAAMGAVSVLLVGVPVVGLASPAGATSVGCSTLNNLSFTPPNAVAGSVNALFDAGDQVIGIAALPAETPPTTVSLEVDFVPVGSTSFPGSVSYTLPTSGFHFVRVVVNGEASVTFSCVPARPPYSGGPLGNCDSTMTAPTKLSSAPGDGSATVSWAPATSDPEGCIAGYVVTPYIGTTAQTPILIPGQGTTTVVKGLTNGTAYTFKVAAQNGISTGPSSDATTPITIGAPVAATTVRAAHVGRGAVKVAFNAPDNNGASITRYTAACKSTNGGVTRAKAGTKSPIVVTGLTAGKIYRCNVTATNQRGNGPASRASSTARA